MDRGEGSQISHWSSNILALPAKFHELLRASSSMINGKQCIVLTSLADMIAHNVELWWNGVFSHETKAANLAAVGDELLRVLKHGLQLVELCIKQDWSKLASIIFGGAGEFCEIVDCAKRYCQSIIFLISNEVKREEGDKIALIQKLRDKIELDCDVLQQTLSWACDQDKQVFLQELRASSRNNKSVISRFRSKIPQPNSAFIKIPQTMVSAFMAMLEGSPKQGSDLPLESNIAYGDLQLQQMKGRGSFGSVKKAMWSGMAVAVKEFEYDDKFLEEKKAVDKFLFTDYSHVVQFFGHSKTDKGKHCLVLELMDGDLKSLINPSIAEAVDIMLQLSKGLQVLHSYGFIHRDLKPQNVLFKIQGDKSLLIKLTDFGTSKEFRTSVGPHTKNTGTKRYMAPEMLNDEGDASYSRKVDVYSFGMFSFYILTGEEPFSQVTQDEQELFVKAGNILTLPRAVPSALRQLLQRCWQLDPKKRPTFSDICEELWVLKEELLTSPQKLGSFTRREARKIFFSEPRKSASK